MLHIVEVIACPHIKCLGNNMYNTSSANLLTDRLKYIYQKEVINYKFCMFKGSNLLQRNLKVYAKIKLYLLGFLSLQ